MNYVEYGKENRDVILLLHGGGLSWWNYREAAQHLMGQYRVILPILDGHAGSHRDFTTIEDNAAEIIGWIDRNCGGSVLLIGGLSLGGQILTEILSQREDICRYALIESALVTPSRITHAMIRPAFGSCYGLIRRRWFAKLQFWYLGIQPALFEDYYRDTCAITKENMIAFLQANALYDLKETFRNCRAKVKILAGGKEGAAMLRSGEKLCRQLPGSTLEILPRLRHGDYSINYARHYADTILKMTEGREAPCSEK